VIPTTGSLPTIGILLVLVAATTLLVRLRTGRVAAPAPSWACGQPVDHHLGFTSAGFTKPLRLVLEALLRPQRAITTTRDGPIITAITYTGSMPPLIDERLYRPAVRVSLAAALRARRLQSGSLALYVTYLAALIVALLAAARLGVIG